MAPEFMGTNEAHGRVGKDGRRRTEAQTPLLESVERAQLQHRPAQISPAMRRVIEESVVEVCSHREWVLFALNVRVEHIHVVVAAEEVEPERVATTLKAYATRRLRERGVVPSDRRIWARHASTHYLFDEDDLSMAIDYTLNHQGPRLPGSTWAPRDSPS